MGQLSQQEELVWSSVLGTLGTGPLPSQSLLPPGTDVITLTATNSVGLSASTGITVYVDDSIDPDGPTMQVSPGSVRGTLAVMSPRPRRRR